MQISMMDWLHVNVSGHEEHIGKVSDQNSVR